MSRGLRWFAAAAASLALLSCNCSQPAAPPAQPAQPTQPVQPAQEAPLKVLAAGEQTITTSDGVKLYAKVAGRGPVCMIVHGGPGQGNLSFERMGIDALEPYLTMVYLDQRGSGKSPDATNYHLDRVVQDFEEARQALGVDKMCLLAHSFGGILAVEYARRYPAHVSELILANATLEFLGASQQRMQIEVINQLLKSLGRDPVAVPPAGDKAALDGARDAARQALFKTDQGFRLLTDNVATIQKMTQLDSSYQRSRGFGRAMFEQRDVYAEYYQDYAPVTALIKQPVLVITSAKDYAVGPDEYKRFRFPDQKVVVLEGGHISYHDNNAAFTEAVRNFMTASRATRNQRT